MFLSKEEREAKKQRDEQIRQLQDQSSKLQAHLDERNKALARTVEQYRQSVCDKWEYLQVSDQKFNVAEGLRIWGEQGWELVGIATYAEGSTIKTVYTLYVFKRKIYKLPQPLLEEFADMPQLFTQLTELFSQIEKLKR